MSTLQPIDAVRAFNRFHTRLVGALDESLLGSGHSLPQARVLYEIASAPRDRPLSARDIGQRLRLDTGYLSRLLAGLESDGLVVRQPSDANARRLGLSLTPRGRDAYAQLNAASAQEIEALLAPLSAAERDELVGAMARIRRLLGDVPEGRTFVLRDPVPGLDHHFRVKRDSRLVDMQTTVRQRPLWRFFPMRDGEWVLWMWRNPFYDTSTRGDFAIGWHVNAADLTSTPAFYRAERFRDHSLFIAFAPVETPRIALAVVVENGGFGARAAAPIARTVLDYFLLGKTPPGMAPVDEAAGAGGND